MAATSEDPVARLRTSVVDLERRRIRVANVQKSEQASDLTVPANCAGLGRIRHFRRQPVASWPCDPLPLDPACSRLGLPPVSMIRAQVFQIAACNWRCWYCFVPYELLAAGQHFSRWITAAELIDLYLDQDEPPSVLDLSGGHPDLAPEWIPWMMRELIARGLDKSVYLWSDDNLSNDYFWRFLSDEDQALISTYRNYGRVGCFKGFSPASFSFNTAAAPELFEKQFSHFAELIAAGVDLYAYVTLTTPSLNHIQEDVARFIDCLQAIDHNLPLRTVPLNIQVFTPVKSRLDPARQAALEHQWIAAEAWARGLEDRFSADDRSLRIDAVPLVRQTRTRND